MGLIKCDECNKDISDTVEQCIHCGFILKNKKNNESSMKRKLLKKFDFTQVEKAKSDDKVMSVVNKMNRSNKKVSRVITWLIFLPLMILLISNNADEGAIIIGALYFFIWFVLLRRLSAGVDLEHHFSHYYYAKKVPVLDRINQDYEEIDLINASSLKELKEKAFKMKADAILLTNVNSYSSTEVTGDRTSVSSKTNHHTDYTGFGIKFYNNEYYKSFDFYEHFKEQNK